MTNAIETTKREMFESLRIVRGCFNSLPIDKLECALESHLEQLRQQYEQMAAAARDRFESLQSTEERCQQLSGQLEDMRQLVDLLRGDALSGQDHLSAMKQERDAIRNKLQAFEFANKSSGEFLIDALRKVKSQRKTIKALRKAQEARESVGATSVSSEGEVSPNTQNGEPKQHSQSCARPVDGVVYVSTTESNGVVSIYCTGCHRMTQKGSMKDAAVDLYAKNLELAKERAKEYTENLAEARK